MVIDYQDDRALTASDLVGTITIAETEASTNKTNETAWGFSNFSNLESGMKTMFGSSIEKTSFSALADLKCYILKKNNAKRCEIGISSDYYPLIKSKSYVDIAMGGTSLRLEVTRAFPDGYDDLVAIGGKAQKNVMFFTNYNAGDSDFFNMIQNSVGKTLDFKISWNS